MHIASHICYTAVDMLTKGWIVQVSAVIIPHKIIDIILADNPCTYTLFRVLQL